MTFALDHLVAFKSVVETGSLGRAAIALHITQPALSRTIRALEERVGAPLFERQSKGMQLTDVGHALLPHAAVLVREAEVAEEEMRVLLGLAKGTVRIGAIGSVASYVLPLALDEFMRRWPLLKVEVVEAVWDRLAQALVKREVDVALGVELAKDDEIDMMSECSWKDSSHVVAAVDHPLRRHRKLTLREAMEQRWALPPAGTVPHAAFAEVLRRQKLEPPATVVTTSSITLLQSLVAQSTFLGWMPRSMFRNIPGIEVLDIPGTSTTSVLRAYRRRAGVLPGPAQRFVEVLREVTRHSGKTRP
jgi:DNA-binding transcriptional LysR family regulator